jgi:hypothetical protein
MPSGVAPATRPSMVSGLPPIGCTSRCGRSAANLPRTTSTKSGTPGPRRRPNAVSDVRSVVRSMPTRPFTIARPPSAWTMRVAHAVAPAPALCLTSGSSASFCQVG